MSSIGQMIVDFFSAYGIFGWLLAIFVLFYIDSIVFPTIPELFVVLIFIGGQGLVPDYQWIIAILVTIALAEVAGLTTLYLIVKRIKVPRRIHSVVERYRDFLLCHDERMILINRVAPVLPFVGAFVAILGWSFRRSIIFTVIGGLIKYGLILIASQYFLTYFSSGTATAVTLGMVFTFLGISFGLSIIRRRRMKSDEDHPA
jgi:membrane protein YqaA with SNARE-associated domain